MTDEKEFVRGETADSFRERESKCTLIMQSYMSLTSFVSVPTFVMFLRDVESPYDVEDYVKLYLGDGKEAQDFAKQFVERRSRWRSSKKANSTEDDLSTPAFGLTSQTEYQPAVSQEFQEVKSKGQDRLASPPPPPPTTAKS